MLPHKAGYENPKTAKSRITENQAQHPPSNGEVAGGLPCEPPGEDLERPVFARAGAAAQQGRILGGGDNDSDEITRLQAMIDEARADPDSVPHEVVREWLLALARGERPPIPEP